MNVSPTTLRQYEPRRLNNASDRHWIEPYCPYPVSSRNFACTQKRSIATINPTIHTHTHTYTHSLFTMSDFQRGLQAFERLVKSDEGIRAGSCRKCGGSKANLQDLHPFILPSESTDTSYLIHSPAAILGGHLTYECRNLIKLDEPKQKTKGSSRFGFLKKQLSVAGSASPSPSGTAVSSPGTGAGDKTASGSGPGSTKKSESSSRKKKRSSSKSGRSSEGSESPSESDSDNSEEERRRRKRRHHKEGSLSRHGRSGNRSHKSHRSHHHSSRDRSRDKSERSNRKSSRRDDRRSRSRSASRSPSRSRSRSR